ncbi:MAG: agmatine/peptidylarginine deiminase [Myxococcota bacterium]
MSEREVGADESGVVLSAAKSALRWPAEWEPHRATWLSWPHNVETWPGRLASVEDAFCEIVRAILPGERVEINVSDGAMASRVGARLLGAGIPDLDRVRFHEVPTNDAWIRDHGGIFVECRDAASASASAEEVTTAAARGAVVDFGFDAWGGKYPPWDLDAAVGARMAEIAGMPRLGESRVLEAGSIDGDGEGTILTTESCLLNPNRHQPGQDRSREGLERMLAESLGARSVLWLGEGIEGDDTDGHVDDLSRFVSPGRVVTVVEEDPQGADFEVLAENRRRLEGMRDAEGRALEVVPLPVPSAIEGPEGRLPASYANFYFCNQALLLPVFGVEQDSEAIERLSSVVSDRPVIPIPSQNLVLGLGSVHCLTQQEPDFLVGD